jgi:hypothetical protein
LDVAVDTVQVTHLCWQGSRRGMLFNDVIAIRHVCSDPQAVIVTLDSDDQLLRHDALRLVHEAHTQVRRNIIHLGGTMDSICTILWLCVSWQWQEAQSNDLSRHVDGQAPLSMSMRQC